MPAWPTIVPGLDALEVVALQLRLGDLADVAEQMRRHLVGRIAARRHFLVDDAGQLPAGVPRRRRPARGWRSRSARSADSSARGGAGRPCRAAAPRRRRSRRPGPQRFIDVLRLLAHERDVEDVRFSTRTLPSRSSSTPRGAGSGSRRRWLFSAISANLSCWATWKIQKPDRQGREGRRDDVLQRRQPGRQAAAIVGQEDWWPLLSLDS